MCRTSFRRKNNVDSARLPPQYLRKHLMAADEAAVGAGPNQKNSLGRKFRRKAQWQRKRRRRRRSTNGSEASPRIQEACLKFPKGLHSPGASKRTASVEALAV